MKVDFRRLHWVDYPSEETPINAENLNRLEEGVAGLYSGMAEIEEALDEIKEEFSKFPFVTPELFGAVGDGETDDTEAWQTAVNLGMPVKATKKIYKCGQINVTKNITIDCNDAAFVCTANTLFNCYGSVVDTIENESAYEANQQYSIANDNYKNYSGYAMLRGTNNFEEARSYYYGGFTCEFYNGRICNTYPVDVEDTEIDIINPITIKISNIGGIAHDNPNNSTRSIIFLYGVNCVLENIKSYASSGYIFVDFNRCLNCAADNLNIKHSYGTTGTNSYIVTWSDSSFCVLKNSNLYNAFWHCATTGAQYLCYHNVVDNCCLKVESGGAYDDHDNARNTIIKNSVVAGIVVTCMATIENVTVISMRDGASQSCSIALIPSSDNRFATYSLSNVRFLPDNVGESLALGGVGIIIAKYPQVKGRTCYIKEVNIGNVKELKGRGGSIRFQNTYATEYTCVIDTLNIDNVNLDIYAGNVDGYSNFDISNYKLNIRNIRTKKDANNKYYPQVGSNSVISFNDVTINNSDVFRIQGKYNDLSLSDVRTYYNANCTIAGTLSGAKLREYSISYLLKNASKCGISDAYDIVTRKMYYNICSENGSINAQRWVNNVLTTEQIAI